MTTSDISVLTCVGSKTLDEVERGGTNLLLDVLKFRERRNGIRPMTNELTTVLEHDEIARRDFEVDPDTNAPIWRVQEVCWTDQAKRPILIFETVRLLLTEHMERPKRPGPLVKRAPTRVAHIALKREPIGSLSGGHVRKLGNLLLRQAKRAMQKVHKRKARVWNVGHDNLSFSEIPLAKLS